ncbi:MAG: tyrosine-type recombinase/integrase [Gammaproteobacteria bacterium]|nr:tyrosine-type recombinase/integrase [Gammaproteobacteria bacterium]
MARRVKDARLMTSAAREQLKIRSEPYWRAISQGSHLGYRKGKRGGTWVARWRKPDGAYREKRLGKADDALQADGVDVLNFSQAHDAAGLFFADEARMAHGIAPETYTVRDAIADYLLNYSGTENGRRSTEYSINSHILPKLGDREVSELTTAEIRKWHRDLARTPARIRSSRFKDQQHKPEPRTANQTRQRRATANRVLTILRAALNYAFREGNAVADDTWRRVEPFRKVEAPLIRYITEDEARRLVNACDDFPFRQLVRAALLTGARYGELTNLEVADFNVAVGSVYIRPGKSGTSRHVSLTDEGAEFFTQVTAGRPNEEVMIQRSDGKIWGHSQQRRRLKAACKRAGINPAIGFHILRHTYGSLLAMQGVPMAVIAAQFGHSDTRMVETHYAHLGPSYVRDTIRSSYPTLGIVEETNVVGLKTKR